MDVSINKTLKDFIKEEQDDHWDQHLEEWKAEKFNVGDRRVLITHWVARAWKRLHKEKKDLIMKTFRQVGLRPIDNFETFQSRKKQHQQSYPSEYVL